VETPRKRPGNGVRKPVGNRNRLRRKGSRLSSGFQRGPKSETLEKGVETAAARPGPGGGRGCRGPGFPRTAGRFHEPQKPGRNQPPQRQRSCAHRRILETPRKRPRFRAGRGAPCRPPSPHPLGRTAPRGRAGPAIPAARRRPAPRTAGSDRGAAAESSRAASVPSRRYLLKYEASSRSTRQCLSEDRCLP